MSKPKRIIGATLRAAAFSLMFHSSLPGQVFRGGPEQGTSDPGVLQSTLTFTGNLEALGLGEPFAPPEGEFDPIPAPFGITPALAPSGSNEQNDPNAWLRGSLLGAPSVLRSFAGLPDLNRAIPPDPIMAAGPEHLMGLVNRRFAIFSKAGGNEKEIDAPAWFDAVLPGNNAFDPKVVFDHFADRWVMVWLQFDVADSTSHILVAASDDSDPNGAWCNWALRGDLNGSTPALNWSDYQGLGFDEDAIYVVPNQFSFYDPANDEFPTFRYVKIRILPKSQVYDPGCPAITWTDLWDLRDPDFQDRTVFTTRPAVTFGSPGVEYLIGSSVFVPHTYMTLWALTNPLDPMPTLTAVNVPVTAANPPPNADQLGGSTIRIDVGGSRVRNVVHRDGSVWTAHSVASDDGLYARARYVRIEVAGPTLLEDVSFGAPGCWLYYPAITSDVNGNMVLVYNQSCTDRYIGIRHTGRTPSDDRLQDSAELKAGETNYVKDFGSGRNRWGDYNGVAVDGRDPHRVWMFAEYAASPENTWGTWFGEVAPRRLGDVNNDGVVDVGDIVLIVDFILELATPDPLDEISADCTQDLAIDVGDLVCVVNLILEATPPSLVAMSRAEAGPAQVRARLEVDPSPAEPERRTVLFEGDLTEGVAALHARIAFDPRALRFGRPQLPARAAGLELASSERGEVLNLILYRLDGGTLPVGAGALVRLPVQVAGPGSSARLETLQIREILVADRAGSVRPGSVERSRLTQLPTSFRLGYPRPNPVGPAGTRLELEIPELVRPSLSGGAATASPGSVRVRVEVFNVRGQRIRTVLDSDLPPGRHDIEWDGRSDRGTLVGAGIYVLRLGAGSFQATRKLIVR